MCIPTQNRITQNLCIYTVRYGVYIYKYIYDNIRVHICVYVCDICIYIILRERERKMVG